MSQKLAGKIAVITGGSSGMGLATAQRFVAEGAYVYITGRRQQHGRVDIVFANAGAGELVPIADVRNSTSKNCSTSM